MFRAVSLISLWRKLVLELECGAFDSVWGYVSTIRVCYVVFKVRLWLQEIISTPDPMHDTLWLHSVNLEKVRRMLQRSGEVVEVGCVGREVQIRAWKSLGRCLVLIRECHDGNMDWRWRSALFAYYHGT